MKPSSMSPLAIKSLCLLVVLLVSVDVTQAQNATFPYGCAYTSGVHSCDYRFALPMTASDFSPPPQQLHIYNIDGLFNAANMLAFNLVNVSQFDANYDASLTLQCQQGGGELILDTTSFTYMNFYKTLHISNCLIVNIPASAFVSLGDLNYFAITGGAIQSADPTAMAGVTVVKDPTSVNPRGELAITNVGFVGGDFDANLIAPQNDVSVLDLSDASINNMDVLFLDGKVSLTTLTLDNNNFTAIPDGVFSGLRALSTVSMAGIHWSCSCSDLWWMTYTADNGIRVVSETICNDPVSYQGERAATYHESVCADEFKCDGGSMPAMNLGNVTCVTYLQLFIYILAIIAFLGLSTLLGLYIKTRRNMARGGGGMGGRRLSGNRVHNAGRQGPPGINKGGWS